MDQVELRVSNLLRCRIALEQRQGMRPDEDPALLVRFYGGPGILERRECIVA